MLKGSLTLFF